MLATPPHLGRILVCLAIFSAIVITTNLFIVQNISVHGTLSRLPLPESLKAKVGLQAHPKSNSGLSEIPEADKIPTVAELRNDGHPIQKLIAKADMEFETVDSARSKSFPEVLEKYRAKYGRHPPPGFDKWYKFARDRNIHDLDDFDQIWDDLRPFWSIPPKDLRKLVRGLQREDYSVSGVIGVRVRSGVVTTTVRNAGEEEEDKTWRAVEFGRMMDVIKDYLPDMDLVMNRLDQPRVIVPWKDLQKALDAEVKSRGLPEDVTNEFSPRSLGEEEKEEGDLPTGEWYSRPGKQYMDIASMGCPPESYTVNNATMAEDLSERTYKIPNSGGIVSNFNLSSDLCTVGPQVAELHGFLFSASSISASHKLIPVFGECKVNVNNDILFPANMYYKNDERYEYDPANDIPWENKEAKVFWRGITSGGVQTEGSWRRLHRHRFVLMTNSTTLSLSNQTYTILTPPPENKETVFSKVAAFAQKYTDIGFNEIMWCVPDGENCGWIKPFLSTVSSVSLTQQFVYKYLIDIDGHSFSGRWHAFLKSRSMGLKATIFREWHDSRLMAWRHFIPVDNRFDDFYTLMTYFIGDGKMQNHDKEAMKIAGQGREWAQKVLRKEDIEIYMLRLMLEYVRLMDDHRETIGYGGDGSEVEENPVWRRLI